MPYRKTKFADPRQQPIPGTQVNWGHWIAQALVGCVLGNVGTGQVTDLVGGGKTTTGTPLWVTSKGGRAVRTSSGGLTGNASDSRLADVTTGKWTIWTYFNIDGGNLANGQFPGIFGRSTYVSESNSQGCDFGCSPPNFVFQSFNNNGSGSYNLAGTTVINTYGTGDAQIGGTSDGTTRRLYFNGVQEATTTNNPTPASNTATGYTVGGRSNNVTWSANIYIGCIWKRAISAREMAHLYREPYCFLQAPRRRVISQVTAAAATPTVVQLPSLGVGQ